jgi:hypothetical protein
VLGTLETPLLRIPLPEGATQLQFGSFAPGLELAPHPEGGLAVLGSVAPGEAQIELAYQLARGEPPARFVRTLAARTPVLSIFVADTGRLAPSSARLHRRRPLRTNDLTYLHFEAFEVVAGESVELELGSLPARARGDEKLALGLVLAAAGAAAWLLTRPLRAGQAGATARGPPPNGASRRERERSTGDPRPRSRPRDGQGRRRGSTPACATTCARALLSRRSAARWRDRRTRSARLPRLWCSDRSHAPLLCECGCAGRQALRDLVLRTRALESASARSSRCIH